MRRRATGGGRGDLGRRRSGSRCGRVWRFGVPRADAGPAGDAAPSFEPPRALTDTDVPYPAERAAAHDARRRDGQAARRRRPAPCRRSRLITPPQPIVRRRGRRGGEGVPVRAGAATAATPVPVEITFTHTFLPPPPPPARPVDSEGPARSVGAARPAGRARHARAGRRRHGHRGRRPSATTASTPTDAGTSGSPLPPGAAQRVGLRARPQPVRAAGDAGRRTRSSAVTYLVERDRYDPYEIVVVGDAAARGGLAHHAARRRDQADPRARSAIRSA